MAKCESMFFCGELSRHADGKQENQEKKRELAALELDLKRREAAFSRVNNSLNKHVGEILLQELPMNRFKTTLKTG